MLVDFDVREKQEMDFSSGGSIIIDYGLVFWPETTLVFKCLDGFVSYKHSLKSCGLLMDYCVFISCLDSHSDGTHSLQTVSQWYNVTFLQICPDEETNSSTSWMAWGWVHYQQVVIFGWTIPLSNSPGFALWPRVYILRSRNKLYLNQFYCKWTRILRTSIFPFYESQWLPATVWLPKFFFCAQQKK